MKQIAFTICFLSVTLASCTDLKSQGFLSDNNEAVQVNTLVFRLFALGTGRTSDNHLLLYLGGTDEEGNSLAPDTLAQAKITVMVNGQSVTIEEDARTWTPVRDLESPAQAHSFILSHSNVSNPYSILNQRDMAGDFTAQVSGSSSFQVISYADYVYEKQTFTDDASDALDVISETSTPYTGGAAMYDALGLSLTSLMIQSRDIKSLTLFANEKDSKSLIFKKATTKALLDQIKPFALFVGSEDADIDELKDLAGVNGAVIYAAEIEDAVEPANKAGEMLSNAIVLDLGPQSIGADSGTAEISATQRTGF